MTVIPVTVPRGKNESPLGLTRRLLFFFHSPLNHEDEGAHPYRVTLQNQVPNSLSEIGSSGGEHITLTPEWSDVEVADIVMFLPKSHSRAVLSNYEEAVDSSILPGRRMSEAELADYDDPPPGFTALGWRGYNLKVGQTLGVHLRMPRSAIESVR